MCKNIHDIKFSWNIIIYALIIILVAAGTIVFIGKFGIPSDVKLSDANLTIVLSFIGVLATFIVIGNFAQVSDIKRSMEQDLDKKSSDIEAINNKAIQLRNAIKAQSSRLGKLESYTTKHVEDLFLTINEQSDADRLYAKDEITKETNKIRYNLQNAEKLILTTILTIHQDYEAIFQLLVRLSKCSVNDLFTITVVNDQQERTLQVTALITENNINFYHNKQRIAPETIKSVEGTSIIFPVLLAIFQLYQDIYAENQQKEYSETTIYTDGQDGEGDIDSFNKNKPE